MQTCSRINSKGLSCCVLRSSSPSSSIVGTYKPGHTSWGFRTHRLDLDDGVVQNTVVRPLVPVSGPPLLQVVVPHHARTLAAGDALLLRETVPSGLRLKQRTDTHDTQAARETESSAKQAPETERLTQTRGPRTKVPTNRGARCQLFLKMCACFSVKGAIFLEVGEENTHARMYEHENAFALRREAHDQHRVTMLRIEKRAHYVHHAQGASRRLGAEQRRNAAATLPSRPIAIVGRDSTPLDSKKKESLGSGHTERS